MQVCRDVEEWIEQQIQQQIQQQGKRCKKWPWPLSWLCQLVMVLVWVFVWVWTKIIRVVCEVVWAVANVLAALINFLAAIPILGPLIVAIGRAISSVISYIVGQLDGIARLAGLRLTKHLRVHVIPLCRGRIPLATEAHVREVMRRTEQIFYERAQIRVHTTFHSPVVNPPESSIHVGMNEDMIFDQAWLKGSWFQVHSLTLFESNVWASLGIGNPVVVYVVAGVGYGEDSSYRGVSGGPFVDWVAVEAMAVGNQIQATAPALGAAPVALQPPLLFPPVVATDFPVVGVPNPEYGEYLVAHEICHALGLMGHDNSNPGELMVPGAITGDALSPFQVGLIRSSAKVTFF
ncbi:hypothetical protein [Azotobacter salinestris]|uniref:hypothetical protein n=1 Tax=Azotobacter salinestris TaxID=69964 RepID=UPI0032E0517A